jgi:uncharacterized protein (TIGR03000 family)
MRILGNSKLWQGAAVAALVALTATDAMAWGRRGGSSSSSSGSYGSSSSGSYGGYYSGSSSSGSYSSSGSSGGGGMFARWHARKAARASSSSSSYGTYYGSSSSSSGSYGYYAGSSGSSSSGSYGAYGYGSYYEAAPVEMHDMDAQPMIDSSPTPPVPAEAAPANPPAAPATPPQASIRLNVPADAKVFVNDRPTTSTGESRNYVSRNLMAGRTYAYDFRVEFQRDGKPVIENKSIHLEAGKSIEMSFGEGQAQMAHEAQPAPTKVTLHVPAAAKVTLAGAATQQSGETRTFITNTLKSGQKWDGYVVKVEMEQNGKMVTEEKTLNVEGGQSYELSFNFAADSTQVASVN